MRKLTGQAVLGMGLLFAAGAALAQYGDRDGRRDGYRNLVRCDSNDNKMHRCPVDTRGGVRLVNRISDSACTEGRSWGYGRDHIWVSAGCRAEFQVGRGGGGWNGNRPDWNDGQGRPGWNGDRDRIVRCDSNDRKMVRCPADTRGGVRLVRKISDAGCYEGRSWGYGRDHIWVSAGCRAEFETGRGWERRR